MFKIKFDNLVLKSNKNKIINNNIVFFFYGIGCCSDDFKFLFNTLGPKFNLYIVELPGHNNIKYSENDLYSFSKKIYLFLKKKNITKITFFAHSLGGIIPIILVITKYNSTINNNNQNKEKAALSRPFLKKNNTFSIPADPIHRLRQDLNVGGFSYPHPGADDTKPPPM